ncbi:CehA/McbA family metallohydrolase [Flavonifractor sp. An91]|uniref:CehA/McbA family metallohydrolase n=1 Tax=Flavonifractor sp. An91 TaxID=1965665 RepID=UPI000B3ADD97|nr:CehA/McbA family metallohydrolase [Flavonifractor sp. An91]OUN12579.1 hypothetical protein B5G42_06375 [Flavonifractor sp. An91]
MTFYLLDDTQIVPEPEPDPEPETTTIAEALDATDGTENLTVKGVVTLIDGKNVYLQDSTGGICARMSGQFDDIALGDTVIATGKRDTYNGLPQLGSATYEKSSGLTLTPTVKTIGELTTADICTYVTIQNVEVTKVFDDNGQYENPNITVEDADGNTIQIYKAVVDKTAIAVNDVITITAAVSVYNDTFQLRNTVASEIKVKQEVTDPITDDMIPEGVKTIDQVANGDQGVSVIGQVVYHYGNPYQGSESINSIILEDVINGEIVGFQIYDYTNYDSYKVGDIVKVTGNVSLYGGVLQMSAPAMEVLQTGVEPIPAQQITISEMGPEYLSEYVYIEGVTLGSYNASGNTTVTDSTGTSNLYKGAPLPSGTVTALYACCSAYNGTYQLRNGRTADYVAEGGSDPGTGTVFPNEGDTVVLYNIGSKGVLAGEGDNQVINNAAATVADGVATPTNGARVFTVEKNGEYYRFKTAHDGYLCSNGTGNNAFYSQTPSEDADWTLAEYNGGFTLESRTAKFNGKYSQFLEYYGGTYKSYSMYNVTDKDIYTFQFYPVAEGVNVTDGVVNVPTVNFTDGGDAFVGRNYTVSFTVDSVFGVKELSAKYGETTAKVTNDNGAYTFTIPAEALSAGVVAISVTGIDNKDVAFSGTLSVTVKDEPVIDTVSPAANAQTGEDKRPEISVTFANAGKNPTVTMTVNDKAVTPTVADGKVSYTPAQDLADGRTTVSVTITRADGKSVSRTWSFTIGTAQYQLYFGQLHSHTTYSDGSGSLESALEYVQNLPDNANVDFVAFTDHSNYFDKSGEANPEAALYDTTQMTAYSQNLWKEYKGTIADFNASQTDVVALAGFEMTWSGGPGHINTFNTEGIVSRNNAALNNKTADAGLKAYYALLSQAEGAASISQFNHPGDTFGTFIDFAYWDPAIDTRIQLVEVGNGEGAIGAGGYYPSYEYYVMALDKGWHVAPTNNQDNHKGKWGNANDARDVILTDDFSEEGIYQAIRDRRVYATEDKNLEINYTLNDAMLGTILDDEGVEQANISVTVYDPDASDSIARVEVVVNSGAVAYTWDDPEELASGALSCTIPADYSYYFIRVTQGDGDLAVTAPVWVGETLKLGISSVTCGTANPVTDEEVTITTNLFNSEAEEATVNSVTYTSRGETLYTDTTGYTIPAAGGTLAIEWKYTPTQARLTPITVTVSMTQGGMEYTYSMEVTLDVLDAGQLVYIGIDASHYNEYVNGNYRDSMGNFGNLAAGYSVRTVQLNTSADLIAACENKDNKYKAIILTAPSRRLAEAQSDPRTYSEAELEALADFNDAGGMVILAGWSDNYENYDVIQSNPDIVHMAATQNAVLEALGSSLRIGDDATYDDVYSKIDGVDAWRLYFNTYNWDSFLTQGVEYDEAHSYDNMYTQLYSHYGGATVYAVDENGDAAATLPATVTPVVYGHDSTYSKDVDGDGLGGSDIPKYPAAEGDNRLMVLATEDLGDGKGLIIVSGAAFMSNFEVQAEVEDSGAEKNYSNYKICENLVNYLNPVTITPIKDVQAQKDEGIKYTIEGVVTSNASGYDKDTAFFDCIYVQDGTAGINAFPVAGNYKIGDKVRITGTTSSYQDERQIAVTSIEKIGEGTAPAPKDITAAQLNDGSVLGSLVTLKGTVESFAKENGLVQTIMVRDSQGNVGRVFIDGYITTDKDVEGLEVGCAITVTGLASYDNTFNAPEGPFPRIRIRDRADVVCTAASTGSSTSYAITVEDSDNGTVTASRTRASKGLTITLTVKADEGYELNVLTVTDKNGNEIKLTDKGDGKYTFAMPASAVTVEASFAAKSVENELPFTDVDVDDWFYGAVKYVYDNGLMNGTSATQFSPFMTTSRAMILTILARYNGVDTSTGATWYEAGVAWAVENGVSDGTNLEAAVSREQLVTMLWRLVGSPVIECDLTAYPDSGSVSDWAAQAMAWAVDTGIIIGTGAGTLNPQGNATRAEVAAMLARFAEND